MVLLCSCDRQEQAVPYTNPILHLDYSDPDVCRVGEDYYMTASSFNCFPGLPILHSRDLVHWEQIGAALVDYPGEGWDAPADDFRTTVQHGKAVWAPAIRYHDGWFYIYVGDPDRGIFMVRTQDPAGRWEPPVWVVRQKGFIDPCPLWEADGTAWLSHGLAGSRAGLKSVLFVAPMAADGCSLIGPSRIVYDGHQTQPTIEGTKFYRRNGWYYIFAPAGGVATGWQTVLRAREPFGPYEERIVMAWAPGTVNGPHQGAWVSAPDGTDRFLHFQDKGAYGRIVHLLPMQWLADDWPLIGEDPDGDGVGQPVHGNGLSGARTAQNGASAHDSSLSGARTPSVGPYGLSYDWQYPAVPSPYWHMALPEGGVRLYSVEQTWPYKSLWDSPNVLQQKFPAEAFTATARLSFCPNPQLKQRGETAGFVVMGNDYAGLRLTDTADGAVLAYIECLGASKGAAETATPLCTLPYTAHPQPHQYASGNVPPVNYPDRQEAVLWVRLEVAPRPVEGNVPDAVCHFSYSLDGSSWTPAGTEFLAQPELWIGAKWGVFCNRFSPKNDAGWLDVYSAVEVIH
ncbi:MAG: family 43 glycosylhydrolase [Bacteroidales bacterium]|nr:family 43 glycosylhydrolase [Bacteroidales bacterium]